MTTIPDAGLNQVATIIGTEWTHVATGSGSTAEATTDTTLATENTTLGAERAAATVTVPPTESTGVTKWVKEFSITGSVTIREIGIFNAASNGDMLIRRVLASDKTYGSGESVTITVTHTQNRSA